MSIIESGLIDILQPLLSSLSGSLDCEGLGPWYFLLGLRIVAIFFSAVPWDTVKEDVACSWTDSMNEKMQEFCMTLCHNLHFSVSVAATWGLEFLALLLLVGLMRLTRPKKKKDKEKKKEKEDKDKGLGTVATAPHGASSDISNVYVGGRCGLSRCYRNYHSHPHHSLYIHHDYIQHADRGVGADRQGTPLIPMASGHGNDVGFVPQDVSGYSMPVHQEHTSQTKMPDHCYDMIQHKMGISLKDMKQTKMPTHDTGMDQYRMSSSPSHVRQIRGAPYYVEKGQYKAPTKYIPVPIQGSPQKGKMTPHVSPGNEHDETFQQRYTEPDGCTKYIGQNKTASRYCEDGQYSMVSKCRPDTEGSMGHIIIGDDSANMTIKHQAVQGNTMHTKCRVNFEAASRRDMGFGSNMYAQPWMAKDSSCRPIGWKNIMTRPSTATGPIAYCHGDATCTRTETDLCHMIPQWEPCCSAEPIHHDGRRYRESTPSLKEKDKMSVTKICGIPVFDMWVALLLATEICFLCAVLIFQVPTLLGRSWICSPGDVECPQTVKCSLKGKAEKRAALWGLAFTSILFIVACTIYFILRICCNKRCHRKGNENEEERGEEVCTADTETERQDEEEGGNEENKERD